VEELKKGYCCLFELDGRGILLLDIGLRIWDANQLEQRTLELVLLRWGKKRAKDARVVQAVDLLLLLGI
jgi:hypothetical protein